MYLHTKLDMLLVFCDYDISSLFDPILLWNSQFSKLGNGGQFDLKVAGLHIYQTTFQNFDLGFGTFFIWVMQFWYRKNFF